MIVLVVTLLIVLLLSACAMRKSEPVKGKHFNPETASVANGERVYMLYCHKCHPAGEAGLGPSINANPAPQFVKRFQVRHGLGVMPAFGKDAISRSDLHDVSRYLKAWKHY